MPCSAYLPNHMLHPGCQPQDRSTKKQELPRPAAWFEKPRSPPSQAVFRKSGKSAHPRSLKNAKKNLTGPQKVEIVKSIWQANMPLLHSNAPVEAAINYLHKNNSSRMACTRFEPLKMKSQYNERGLRTMSLCGESVRSAGLRETSAVKSGVFPEKMSLAPKDKPGQSRCPDVHNTPRKWPERKASKIKVAELQLSKTNIGSMSPVSALHEQVWSSSPLDKVSAMATHPAVISPLSINSPQPSQSATSKFNQSPVLDRSWNSPYQNSPRSGPGMSTAASSAGWTPNINSSEPSRNSFEVFPDAIFPVKTVNGVSPTKRYDLISPVSAGVFDDSPRLKRNPTFRKQLSIRESKMKPLPPAPDMPVAPLVIRRQTPLGLEPVFLPQKPQPSDLDSLDEAFRRSGLLEDSCSDPHSPSLREATEQLEKQLCRMSSTASFGNSVLVQSPEFSNPSHAASKDKDPSNSPFQGSLCAVEQAHAKSSATQAPHPNRLSECASANKESDPYIAAKQFALRRSATLSAQNLRKTQRYSQLKHHHSCGSISEASRSNFPDFRNSSPHRTPTFTRELNRSPSISKEKAGTASYARLRLPRIRTTELPSESPRRRASLSIVVESASEGDILRTDAMNERVLSLTTDNLWAELSSSHVQKSQDGLQTPKVQSPDTQSPSEQANLFSNLIELFSASCTPSRASGVQEQVINDVPVAAAEEIVLRILQSVDTLEDLFNLAVLNRAFYTIFKKHELPLIKRTLFRMSPAAWELREMSTPWEDDDYDVGIVDRPVPEYTPNLYIRHYMRDLCTMVSLKWLMLVRCESLLRPETVRALAGQDEERSVEVDDAFWRVWTFCRLFGCGKGREEDITAQADWLSGGSHAQSANRKSSAVITCPLAVDSVLFDPPEGFALGNEGGLTATQLYDMMEIWTCLGVLVQVFHGKHDEARQYGVFDDADVKVGDVAEEDHLLVEGWTQYLLTLGPSAILTLSSLNPDTPIETMFARAQSLGWTKWTSPTKAKSGSDRSFLKEAISRVYDNQLVRGEMSLRFHTPQIAQSRSQHASRQSSQKRSRSYSAGASISRQRRREFAAELRRRKQETKEQAENSKSTPAVEERPISNFQEVIRRLNGSLTNPQSELSTPKPSQSPPPAPTKPTENITTTASRVNITARSLAPVEVASQSRHPSPAPRRKRSRTPPPGFVDPADRALNKLVHELGFSEEDAKWALKCTDTGESLDVEAAINLLLPKVGTNGAVAGCSRSSAAGENTQSPLSPLPPPPLYQNVDTTFQINMADTDPSHMPTWRWA
ncbi:hypothetical protein PRK78_006981 [Emydomyces testavorans]|uniref:Uncharacterized protein n=1 Tax=Emydomyces testavorans TaxID=2070801 RepID=A0AAF0DQD4_9EURO|nr:hypothetical protein PRK78_006981 [Emydomyces testavorans]